jgi:hypothetical protein
MKQKKYEAELRRLQVQLSHLQRWVKEKGARVIIIFEGRDGAGKGGTIRSITERVSPRVFRVVALPAPSDREKSQMYMQRYMQHFPAAGEIVIFDRSWYNRAGVERVMGFATDEQYERFMKNCPEVEHFIVEGGIKLIKIWLEVSPDEQRRRPAPAVEAEPDGSAVARAVVRLLEGARSHVQGDRHGLRAVVHSPLGRQAHRAAERDLAHPVADPVQEAAAREGQAA